MLEKMKNNEVKAIVGDSTLTRQDRIKKLMRLRDDARAEQRMASEGGAVDDDGLNSKLRDAEIALEHLGEDPAEEEGRGPASL